MSESLLPRGGPVRRGFELMFRSRLLGFLLAAAGLAIALRRWDWPEQTTFGWSTSAAAFAMSCASYAAALASLAWMLLPDRPGFVAALSGQLLKYVPGIVWQAQPVYASRGFEGVGRLVAVTMFAASVALGQSGSSILTMAGLVTGIITAATAWAFWGPRTMARLVGLGTLTCLLIFLSGALPGYLIDGRGIYWGRTIASAWGAGVVAVPVPAGLGVREAVIALSAHGVNAPVVAGIHRGATILVDVVVGGLAVSARHAFLHGSPAPLTTAHDIQTETEGE